jgi:hypothetical protein
MEELSAEERRGKIEDDEEQGRESESDPPPPPFLWRRFTRKPSNQRVLEFSWVVVATSSIPSQPTFLSTLPLVGFLLFCPFPSPPPPHDDGNDHARGASDGGGGGRGGVPPRQPLVKSSNEARGARKEKAGKESDDEEKSEGTWDCPAGFFLFFFFFPLLGAPREKPTSSSTVQDISQLPGLPPAQPHHLTLPLFFFLLPPPSPPTNISSSSPFAKKGVGKEKAAGHFLPTHTTPTLTRRVREGEGQRGGLSVSVVR